jgi:hypothetical protein
MLDEAVREALRVEDPAGRATALSSFVPNLPPAASTGPALQAGTSREAVLAAAIPTVAVVTPPSLLVELLGRLIPHLQPPLLEEAAALVRAVEDPEVRCHGLVALANAWRDRRQQLALEAAEAAASVGNPAARTACQGEAAVALARAGAAEAATRLAETVDNEQSRLTIMSAIADALVTSGEHRRAAGLAMATLTPASRVRTSSLERPILRLAQAGRRGEAVVLAERLLAAESGLGR